jgi:hypothetical protein
MDVIFWTCVQNPKFVFRAIGPYQLAWWLRTKGYECQVIDMVHTMSVNELVSYTEKFISSNTLCIGVSSTFFSNFDNAAKRHAWLRRIPAMYVEAIKIIRQRHPNIKIALGGGLCDLLYPEELSIFDVTIIGDAEDSFLEVLEEWRKGRKFVFAAESRGGKPYITTAKEKHFNIEECSHKFAEQDCIIDGEALPIEISRGCIFRCKFCQYPNIGKTKFDYLRREELIKEEMDHNYKNFKTTNYYILDDTFNDSDHKMQMWKRIVDGLGYKINYTGYLRADLLQRRPEHIELLKNTGLMSAFFGIESFHPDASRLVGKAWSGKGGKDFILNLKDLWKDDITMHLSMIVGLPPETEADYDNSHKWCVDNKIDFWSWNRLSITPGVRLYSSEFDKTPEAFGFAYDYDTLEWSTAHMTQKDANRIAGKLNTGVGYQLKHTSWNALSLMNFGIERHMLNTLPMHSLEHLVQRGRKPFIEQYKTKLKNISV